MHQTIKNLTYIVVSRGWIFAPLVGILLSLDKHSTEESTLFYDAILSDASFKMEAFEFLLKFSWEQGTLLLFIEGSE